MITDEIIIALLREEGIDAFKQFHDSPHITIRYEGERLGLMLCDGCLDTMVTREGPGFPKFQLCDPNWIDGVKTWLATWKGPVCNV